MIYQMIFGAKKNIRVTLAKSCHFQLRIKTPGNSRNVATALVSLRKTQCQGSSLYRAEYRNDH
jgi:hypothetical protein